MASVKKLGPYELRGELGRGAMAKVWRAYDPKLEREVAIKEPLFDEKLSKDILAEMSERFVKEGKAAARLNHPGIVTIFAADVYGKRPAIVMELVEGITLGDLLEQGSLSPLATLQILDQLLDAVGYAHSQGVVHRDIKPDNIFVTADGRVKLGDFGIAHIEDTTATRKTQIGTVLGTPGYMAPEQATGAPIDRRTDLFSIGTIAYEMLSGKNPFGAGETSDSTTLLYRIVHEAPPALPAIAEGELPQDIRPAILAALNKNPDERPQDAESFKAMLHGAPAPLPGTMAAPSPGLASAVASKQQRKWLPYVLVGVLGIVVIAVALLFATSGGSGGGVVTGPVQQGAESDSTVSLDANIIKYVGGTLAEVKADFPNLEFSGNQTYFNNYGHGYLSYKVPASDFAFQTGWDYISSGADLASYDGESFDKHSTEEVYEVNGKLGALVKNMGASIGLEEFMNAIGSSQVYYLFPTDGGDSHHNLYFNAKVNGVTYLVTIRCWLNYDTTLAKYEHEGPETLWYDYPVSVTLDTGEASWFELYDYHRLFDDPSLLVTADGTDPGAASGQPAAAAGDFVFSDSDKRYLTQAEVSNLSQWDLLVARNEIFARHGRQFNYEDLRVYFNAKSWYVPLYTAEAYDAMPNQLNSYEFANVELIKSVEDARGYY